LQNSGVHSQSCETKGYFGFSGASCNLQMAGKNFFLLFASCALPLAETP